MLTHHDQTVPNAFAVYQEVKDTGLRYIGFKDIGLPFPDLKKLARMMHDGGQKVMLEVVSPNKEEELKAARNAAELGVDFMMGGTHAKDVAKIIAGSGIKYFPFPGRVVGHPSVLEGSIDEIVNSARELEAIENVGGLDLLAYRHSGDVEAIMSAVCAAVKIPVVMAGSIASNDRIEAVKKSGAWGFTMGSALFDGSYLQGSNLSIAEKIKKILGK